MGYESAWEANNSESVQQNQKDCSFINNHEPVSVRLNVCEGSDMALAARISLQSSHGSQLVNKQVALRNKGIMQLVTN